MVNPPPKWILTDAGTQYTSDVFQNFCMNLGIGLLTALLKLTGCLELKKAFQWVRGGATPQDPLPAGINPRKAFDGLLRLKEKARIAFEQEHTKYKLSRLNNSIGRSPPAHKPGSLVMIWRQGMRPGKTSGHGKVQFVFCCKKEALYGWAVEAL
eukprot:s1130_g15.t1